MLRWVITTVVRAITGMVVVSRAVAVISVEIRSILIIRVVSTLMTTDVALAFTDLYGYTVEGRRLNGILPNERETPFVT